LPDDSYFSITLCEQRSPSISIAYFSNCSIPKSWSFESLLPGLVLELEMGCQLATNSHYGVTGIDALIVG
jgi:hypothetical protein